MPSKGRILYIEDNSDNRKLVRRVLEIEGYDVVEAGSGGEAMERLAAEPIDLALMDINMPEIDGYTLTTRIRSNPRFTRLPIVAVTANVMRGDRERSLKAGCDGYIQKPIDIDTLSQQIERFLTPRRTTPPPAPSDTQPLAQPAIPKDAAVLVVEDNVSNFVLVARMLGYLGVHCEWKTSGYEVLEYADALPRLDLILMDIRLPYEDGFAAQRKLRASERFKKVPIVAVTANASQDQLARARAAGFDGFLGKPLNPDRFPEQIRRILNGDAVWDLS
jgi:two-component system cell cycle response regulator DivK